MPKNIITSINAPAPIGPYSQAIKTGDLLFLSGQIALNPETNQLINNNIIEETHQVMKNLQAILKEAGMNFNNTVKTTIYLNDMAWFTEVNEVYGTYFSGNFPARETIAVKALPKEARVEISMIASF
jgi:2-iminobutanoate/2-iminopropanoate deaminase